MNAGVGVRFVFLVSVGMALVGVPVGFGLLDHKAFPLPRDLAICLGPIATAAILFLVAGIVFRGLTYPGKLTFPLNITLPIVFAFLVRVSVLIWASPASAAFRTPDVLEPALMWSRFPPLAILSLAQCIVLSLGALISA